MVIIDSADESLSTGRYAISKKVINQALWQSIMQTNLSEVISLEHPVTNVSWDDCQQFIQKLNQLTGYNFDLPTEKQNVICLN